jgi:uncharacterized protein with NRDE domain
MCLVLLAFKSRPDFKLILAANRDEFYDRPTAPAAFWEEAPQILAGRDLRAGGTWLGITRNGRIGLLTNYRDPASIKEGAPSRGTLVRDYLLGNEAPLSYLERLAREGHQYNGFNLLIGDRGCLCYYSNRLERPRVLGQGIYGLSNHLLETPWPKVVRAKKRFATLISKADVPGRDQLFRILEDRTPARDEDLPDTGIGLEWERLLSAIFITSPQYGTRSSAVLRIDQEDRVVFAEKSYASAAEPATYVEFEFGIES